MKKLLIAMAVIALATSCLKNEESGLDPITVKFVQSITAADGSKVLLGYDTNGRITSIDCSGETFGDVYYSVDWNMGASFATSNVRVTNIATRDAYLFKFTDFGAINNLYKIGADGSETLLSTYEYNVMGNAVFLTSVTNAASKSKSEYVWDPYNYVPAKLQTTFGSVKTTVTYTYEVAFSNLRANVNLFLMLHPEYLQNSGLEPVVAMCITAFGLRSYYLPTAVGIAVKDSDAEEGTEDAETKVVTRKYDFDEDSSQYIQRIYNDNTSGKSLLYSITYFEMTPGSLDEK